LQTESLLDKSLIDYNRIGLVISKDEKLFKTSIYYNNANVVIKGTESEISNLVLDKICELVNQGYSTTQLIVAPTSSFHRMETKKSTKKLNSSFRDTSPTILTPRVQSTKSFTSKATDISSKEWNKVEKEIDEFVSGNVTENELKNNTWSEEFLSKSSDLLLKGIKDFKFESETKVATLIEVMGKTFKKIGQYQENGTVINFNRNELNIEISSFDQRSFTGINYDNNSTITVNLPKTIFPNTDEKVVVVVMTMPTPYYMSKVDRFSVKNIMIIETFPPTNEYLTDPLTYSIQKEDVSKKYKCVFWNESLLVSNKWDGAGCYKVNTSNENVVTCQCYHMTSFSLLMQTEEIKISPADENALTMITYIGCSVSIFACVALILLYMAFGRIMKFDRNLIHMNLCIAIAMGNCLFLIADHVADHRNLCMGISVSLLYCYLASFFWLLIEGIHVYSMVVKIFVTSNRWKMYMIIGWVIPVIIVSVTAAKFHPYFIRQHFCWISTEKNLIWSFIGPVIFVIVVNTYMLVRTLIVSYKMDRSTSTIRKYRKMAHLAMILMPVFGLTWVFGFFSINNNKLIFFQYIFNLLNSFQGLFIFIFYALLNNDLRREYDRYRRTSLYFTSSSRSSETTVEDVPNKRWSQISIKSIFRSNNNNNNTGSNNDTGKAFYVNSESL